MQQKIALSASGYDCPGVVRLLEDCDLIYTTNVMQRDELYALFGPEYVKFIPDCGESMMAFLRERHEGAEFVTYSQLYEIFSKERVERKEQWAEALTNVDPFISDDQAKVIVDGFIVDSSFSGVTYVGTPKLSENWLSEVWAAAGKGDTHGLGHVLDTEDVR